MAEKHSTPPLAAGLDTSPAHPDADLVALFQAGEHVEAGERHAILRRMATTPATTPSGIIIKVQALVDEFDVIGSSAHGPDVLASILDDLERQE